MIILTKIDTISNYYRYSINSSKVTIDIDCNTGVTCFTVKSDIFIDATLILTACGILNTRWKLNNKLPSKLIHV